MLSFLRKIRLRVGLLKILMPAQNVANFVTHSCFCSPYFRVKASKRRKCEEYKDEDGARERERERQPMDLRRVGYLLRWLTMAADPTQPAHSTHRSLFSLPADEACR